MSLLVHSSFCKAIAAHMMRYEQQRSAFGPMYFSEAEIPDIFEPDEELGRLLVNPLTDNA